MLDPEDMHSILIEQQQTIAELTHSVNTLVNKVILLEEEVKSNRQWIDEFSNGIMKRFK